MKYRKTRSTFVVMLVGLLPALLGFLLVVPKAQEGVVNFLTHHLNNARTGWNSNETVLTPDRVQDLHKLWQQSGINGQIYATPLYYHVKGQELLFMATQTNWFYILDANDGRIRYGNPLPDEPPLDQFTFE